MRIAEQTNDRMRLVGVPGGRGWMLVLSVFGAVATAAVTGFAVALYRENDGFALPHLMLAFGFVLAQVFLWTGLVTLIVGRISLELDRSTGMGEYRVRSPIVEAGKPCRFELTRVAAVALEAAREWRPGHNGGAGRDVVVTRARLRITKPRRAITLDETENQRLKRVRTIAEVVAAFLDVPLEREA